MFFVDVFFVKRAFRHSTRVRASLTLMIDVKLTVWPSKWRMSLWISVTLIPETFRAVLRCLILLIASSMVLLMSACTISFSKVA